METRDIKYSEVGNLPHLDDKYGIVAYGLEQRKRIFLANPRIDSKLTFLFLMLSDGVVVGRCYYFKGAMKAGNEVYDSLSTSALEVAEPYRAQTFGPAIMFNTLSNKIYPFQIISCISAIALPIYRQLRYTVFAIPKYRLFYNSTAHLANKGLRGLLLKGVAGIVNRVRRLKYRRYGKADNRFTVKCLDKVPEWVDDIALNDGHKYMEAHDSKWMQWNIMGSFGNHKGDYTRFFGIYRGAEPIGFFMTNRRVTLESVNMSNGNIVEWGATNGSTLSELEIYKLAIPTFGDDVSDIFIGTVDSSTQTGVKKMGFKHIGDEHVAVRDVNKTFKDISDESLWRLRIGYTDGIFS